MTSVHGLKHKARAQHLYNKQWRQFTSPEVSVGKRAFRQGANKMLRCILLLSHRTKSLCNWDQFGYRRENRERGRERHTHTQRQRQRDRQTDRQTERDRETETETERHYRKKGKNISNWALGRVDSAEMVGECFQSHSHPTLARSTQPKKKSWPTFLFVFTYNNRLCVRSSYVKDYLLKKIAYWFVQHEKSNRFSGKVIL